MSNTVKTNSVQEQSILVFRKKHKITKGGKEVEFSTYLTKVPCTVAREDENGEVTNVEIERYLTVKLSNQVKDKVEKSGVEFPMTFKLGSKDYFCVEKPYEDRHKEKAFEKQLVITNYQDIVHVEIEAPSISEFASR